jgi:hypothetical protein
MRRLQSFVLGAILTIITTAPAAAQQTEEPTEEQAVRAVIDRLFDGMRSRDTTMIRSAFAEEAQFYGVAPDGTIRIDRPSGFIATVAQAAPDRVLDEVLHDVEIRVDGPLAIVWTYYDFFAGDEFSHCGYDAFQLLKVRGEWKIVAVADTRRREGCRQQRG